MGLFTRKVVIDPIAILKDVYEREIALLQEQLADARADAQRHCERADHAVDYLANRIGLQAISAAGKAEAQEAVRRVTEHAEKAARIDPFDDLPFEGGDGIYSKRDEALL